MTTSQCQDPRHAEPHPLPCDCCTEHCDPQEWVEIEEDQAMNTQDDTISAAELTTPEPTPITREGLIEKLIEHRAENWDHDDTVNILEYGRTGFAEMTNEVLEEIANDDYMLVDEDGNEVRYTITDACPITSKPTPEAINAELLEVAKAAYVWIEGNPGLTNALKAAIAKAEGK